MKSANTQTKLFNLPVLLLITVVLIGFFVLLFPWKSANFLGSQDSDALKEQFSSRLQAEYHQLLQNPEASNQDVLSLAQAMTKKGLWENSRTLITERLNEPALSSTQKKQLATIQLRNYLDAYYTASAAGDNPKDQLIDVRQHLQFLDDYQNLQPKELQSLAKASTSFGLLPQAVKIYQRLADIDQENRAAWLAEAGRWAGHAGDPVSSAAAFKEASQLSRGTGRFNAYTYAWLKAASQAGQKDEIKTFLTETRYQLPQEPKALEALATASLEAGIPESASDLYAHLAKRDEPNKAQRWLEKAAHWAAETESYDNASHYLKQAASLATSDSDKWAINQRLIEVYIKDKREDEALAIIKPLIESNPNNTGLLRKGVEIALLEKEMSLARAWNKVHLKRQPNSLKALLSQTDIETIDENFDEAVSFIKRVVKLNPKNLEFRERWAYLEEVEGNDALALQLWQWMYQQKASDKYQQQVIRLAQANFEGEGLALLMNLARQQPLPTQTVNDIFFYLAKNDRKADAVQFISNYSDQHGPIQSLLETLANWYGAEKRYAEAITVWKQLEQTFGNSTEYSLHRFELHWALEQKEQAMALWKHHKQDWLTIAKPAQVAIMAEVAWSYEQNAVALSYYQRLIKTSDKNNIKERVLYHTRIALLHGKLNQPQLAIQAVQRGFMETADADLMLNGLQITFDAKDFNGFNTLLSLSKEQSSRFAKEPRYWLLQAAFANQQKRYSDATALFQKVLAINPNSKDALEGIRGINVLIADAKKQSILKKVAAMQTAFDQKDFALLNKLLNAAEETPSVFAELPQYWAIRSQFSFQQKQYQRALNNYKQLLKLQPDSIPAKQGIILSLTQLKQFAALKQVLAHWQAIAENNYDLWPNYATAYQAMGNYQASLKWFEMASIKHPENYTMLLSYAVSLEKLGREAEANRVRAAGVKQLQIQLASGKFTQDERKEALFQYLSALTKVGTQAQFDSIYAQLDKITRTQADKDRMNEIAFSWALDKNNIAQLKRLLARADTQRMKKPLWMQLAIALKLKDKQALASLLKQHADELSTSDRVSALIALNRQNEAFNVAKRAMTSGKTQEERDIARKIALSLADGRVSEFVAAYDAKRIGDLSINEQSLQYKQGLGKNDRPYAWDIKLKKAQLSDNSIAGSKVNEKDVSVGFEWKDTTDQVNARLGIYDNGSDAQAYGNLRYQKQLNDMFSAGVEYGYQETPTESSYLRQYGRRDRLKVDLNAKLSEKNSAQLSVWQHEFNRTDNGGQLADGTGARASVIHRQNTLNGQWYGGVQGTLQRNNNASDVSAENALSESTQSVELIAGFTHGTPGQGISGKSDLSYSGSVALGKEWPTGEVTAHAEAAVSKDLFDNDELSLAVFYDKGTESEDEDKGLLLKYRKFLDFQVTPK
ncbi:tetratricopeptide repeat protein [Leucothrix sargassi]|nr:tetratricopeptide repeat protein [Leucothrix sargassi]